MKVELSLCRTKPVYDRHIGNKIYKNRSILEVDRIDLVNLKNEATHDSIFSIVTFTGRSTDYMHQYTGEIHTLMTYEIIGYCETFKEAHEAVISNRKDLSKKGTNIFIAIDEYKLGFLMDRKWYKYEVASSKYTPCKTPKILEYVGTSESNRSNFELTEKETLEKKISIYET